MKKNIKLILLIVACMFFIAGCKDKEATALEYGFDDARNGYVVTGLKSKDEKKVTIPESYKGKKVVGIAKEAFKDTGILVVHIPKTVEIIGAKAFENAKTLVNIDIAEGVKEISDFAFKNCTALNEVKIPSSVESMGSSIFSGCRLLEKMSVPFIGKSIDSKRDEGLVGYLFGNENAPGMAELVQVFGEDSDSSPLEFTYSIPPALQELEVTKGNKITYGAFYNCNTLKKVTYTSEIKYIEPYAFYNCLLLSELDINNIDGYIGEHAFERCGSLTKISIDSDVEEIGEYAFTRCASLKEVIFEKNNKGLVIPKGCFYHCDYLEKVTLNEGITAIEENAFGYCYFLNKVQLCSTLTSIGKQAFYKPITEKSQVKLTINLDAAKNLTLIDDYAFTNSNISGVVDIPSNVKKIGALAFAENKYLTGINLAYGVEEIGRSCFENSPILENVNIPDSVTKIGDSAFDGCPALKYDSSSDEIDYLGNWVIKARNKKITMASLKPTTVGIVGGAFAGCTSLEKVIASNKLVYLGDMAFKGCENLVTVSLGEGIQYYGVYAFYGCAKLKVGYIGDNATYIGRGIFSGCAALTKLDVPFLSSQIRQVNEAYLGYMFDVDIYKNQARYIPATLKEVIVRKQMVIGNGAFYECRNIENITFKSGITLIGMEAFYNCESLTSIDLSKTITKISKYAFYNCSSLADIYIPKTVNVIDEAAFMGCTNLTIKCEATSKPSGWHDLWTTTDKIIWGA